MDARREIYRGKHTSATSYHPVPDMETKSAKEGNNLREEKYILEMKENETRDEN